MKRDFKDKFKRILAVAALSFVTVTCGMIIPAAAAVQSAQPTQQWAQQQPPDTTQIDVGNHNSYSGGSSRKSSGSSSKSSSKSSSSSSSSSSSGGGLVTGIIAVVIVVGIVIFFAKFASKSTKNGSGGLQNRTDLPVPMNFQPQITNAICAIDPAFNPDSFLTFAADTFITLQNAWTARDWSQIRPFEKEELYTQHQQQLQEYINLGRINVIENIVVNQAFLQKYVRDNNYEYLTVYMDTNMNDYIIDEKSGKLLKGDKTTSWNMKYLLTFMRKTGIGTAAHNTAEKMCPHCGAPLNISSAGVCEYCGSLVTTGEFDWVLSDLDSIRPDMTIDNRGIYIDDNNNQN